MGPRLTPLEEASDEQAFGGKAVSLGSALRSGLPVPPGLALDVGLVDAIAAGDTSAIAALASDSALPDGPYAVRSSAVGEDSSGTSFAGQHTTVLNVARAELHAAVYVVWASGRSEAALAYRARRGVSSAPAVGVVIEPLAAGVLFTRNPITGADERVIEAAWGLGEVVVSGRIIPDYYRLDARGGLLEQVPGDKDVQIVRGEGEGTIEVPVADDLRRVACLQLPHLDGLHALGERCRAIWRTDLDIEWALGLAGRLYLLQARPITAGPGRPG